MLIQHHPTLLNPTCCTRLATMLHDVAWCWTKFDFHQTLSSTSSNISFVLRCQQKCCIRLAIVFNIAVICIHGNYWLVIVASALPRGCKDTVWRTSDLSANRKRKSKATVKNERSGKSRRWCLIYSCIKQAFFSSQLVAFVWQPRWTLCNIIQQCWIQQCWMMLDPFGRALSYLIFHVI